jgi:hypothetical protein
MSTTVRHTPLTAMLSPGSTSAMGSLPVSTPMRMSPPRCSSDVIFPTACMMPVNMVLFLKISSHRKDAEKGENEFTAKK